jgi:hypothetical protein
MILIRICFSHTHSHLSVCYRRSGFLTGPEDLSDPQAPINLPRVYVGADGQPHFLVIYQVQ